MLFMAEVSATSSVARQIIQSEGSTAMSNTDLRGAAAGGKLGLYNRGCMETARTNKQRSEGSEYISPAPDHQHIPLYVNSGNLGVARGVNRPAHVEYPDSQSDSDEDNRDNVIDNIRGRGSGSGSNGVA